MSKIPDAIDDLIKEIMIKHSIAIGRDDPILILHTVNTRLLNDSHKALNTHIEQAQQQWQDMTNRWGQDTKDKAERILNTTLIASKDVMASTFQEGTLTVRKEVESILHQAHTQLRRAYRLSILSFIMAILILLVCSAMIWIMPKLF